MAQLKRKYEEDLRRNMDEFEVACEKRVRTKIHKDRFVHDTETANKLKSLEETIKEQTHTNQELAQTNQDQSQTIKDL